MLIRTVRLSVNLPATKCTYKVERLLHTNFKKGSVQNCIIFAVGYTPVMVAAELGDSDSLTLLLEAGASVNCRVSKTVHL